MVAGSGYVCIQILANAIETAGSLDREKIRDALAATDMMTIAGPISFNADGTPKIHDKDGKPLAISGMVQWLKGKQELIWPKEYATVPLVYPAKPFNE